ncbi:MAG: sialidase family protein, partial [Bryobacteraceae bacterium]
MTTTAKKKLILSLCIAPLLGSAASIAPPSKTDLFEGGKGGYVTYRIPALAITKKGTLLAFCAARKGFGDWSNIDIALRRSTDGGKTWDGPRIIADAGEGTADNPTPIFDRRTGAVHF